YGRVKASGAVAADDLYPATVRDLSDDVLVDQYPGGRTTVDIDAYPDAASGRKYRGVADVVVHEPAVQGSARGRRLYRGTEEVNRVGSLIEECVRQYLIGD